MLDIRQSIQPAFLNAVLRLFLINSHYKYERFWDFDVNNMTVQMRHEYKVIVCHLCAVSGWDKRQLANKFSARLEILA